MTAARTPSQIGRASRAKGGKYQRDVARAIRPWFPDAESGRVNGWRSATHVSADEGDLAKTAPGLFWSLKNVDRAATDPASLILAWMAEAREKAAGRVALLVQKRSGYADPLASWCWLRLRDLLELSFPESVPFAYLGPSGDEPVRMEFRAVLSLLAAAGYALDPERAA